MVMNSSDVEMKAPTAMQRAAKYVSTCGSNRSAVGIERVRTVTATVVSEVGSWVLNH